VIYSSGLATGPNSDVYNDHITERKYAVSTLGRGSYHHGDLRAACLNAAMDLLAEGDETTLSLRAVARRAGVSPNAPYRHYPDKDALLAAMAAHGYQDLREALLEADAAAPREDKFVAMAQAYVRFGVGNPALFHLMFGHPCSRNHPETTAAAALTTAVLAERVAAVIPAAQHGAFMIGAWALVHGLASLVLDGKLPSGDQEALDGLVRSTVETMLGVQA
jgi:AcrR family transcriptional regulator